MTYFYITYVFVLIFMGSNKPLNLENMPLRKFQKLLTQKNLFAYIGNINIFKLLKTAIYKIYILKFIKIVKNLDSNFLQIILEANNTYYYYDY